jgi:hypothetical protein
MQFLKASPDPRSNSLAGSVVGETNAAASIFWNPSGTVILDSQRIHVQTGNTQYFAGVTANHAAVVYQTNDLRSFGVGLFNMRSADMAVTTEFLPQGTGQTFGVNDLVLAFSYAQMLTDYFSFGLVAKYAEDNIAGVVTRAGLVDLGFQYQIGFRDISFGVGIANFGFNATPTGEIELVGIHQVATRTDFEEISVPATFKMGLSGNLLKRNANILKANLQLNHPTDNRESLSVGFEYARKGMLFVRSGYLLGHDGTYPTFGTGVRLMRRFGYLEVDYAFVARQSLGYSHQLGLGFSI